MKQNDKHLIPYKYIDANNKIYNDSISVSNSKDSDEASQQKQKPIITKSKTNSKTTNSKLSKTEEEEEEDDESSASINYDELTEEEIKKLIEKRNNKILKLNSTKDKLKQKLTYMIKKINEQISENAEILYKKEVDPSIVEKLVDHYETRKKSLQVEQKINHSYKCQFNLLKTKAGIENLDDKEINADLTSLMNSGNKNKKTIEDQINEIREENKNILLRIKEIKDKKVPQQKEVELIDENNTNLQRKVEETQQLSLVKIDACNKFKDCQNKVHSILKEIDFSEEKILQHDKNYIDQDLLKDYLHWIEMIKNELNKNQDNLVMMLKNGQSEFINELKKRRALRNQSVKKKKKNISAEGSEQNIQNIQNIQNTDDKQKDKSEKNEKSDKIEKNEKNEKNEKKVKKDKNDKKEKKEKNDKKEKKEKNIKEEDKNKNPRKNIYNLLSILNNIDLNDLKNNNDDNINKKDGSYFITENIIETNVKKENEKLKDMSKDLALLNSITVGDFRELMNKKEEYLDTNLRLDKTLKEYLKTKNSKLLSISKTIKSKGEELNILKEKNSILQEEVSNLENVLQLSLEKEKIQKEIMAKMCPPVPPVTINNDINKEKSNIISNTNETNENNIKIESSRSKKQKKNIQEKNKNIEENESRGELLKKIKKKYMEEEKEDEKKISEINSKIEDNKSVEENNVEIEKNKQNDDNKIENSEKENNLEKSNENIENVAENNNSNEMINSENDLKEHSEIPEKQSLENNMSDDVEKELINNIEEKENNVDYQQ